MMGDQTVQLIRASRWNLEITYGDQFEVSLTAVGEGRERDKVTVSFRPGEIEVTTGRHTEIFRPDNPVDLMIDSLPFLMTTDSSMLHVLAFRPVVLSSDGLLVTVGGRMWHIPLPRQIIQMAVLEVCRDSLKGREILRGPAEV